VLSQRGCVKLGFDKRADWLRRVARLLGGSSRVKWSLAAPPPVTLETPLTLLQTFSVYKSIYVYLQDRNEVRASLALAAAAERLPLFSAASVS
jgi:hypothetical protein